jgi:Na+/melibiose symporter-like transporter
VNFFYRLLRLDFERTDDRNAWFLVLEIFWAAVLGGAASFTSAYAVRLGATNADIGLLTSLPALLAVLVSIPSGRFLKSRSQHKPWLLSALSIHRAGYAVAALVPWLPLPDHLRGQVAVAIFIGMTLPVHFFNVGWVPMLAQVIPVDKRASVITARNIVFNATMSASTFIFGLWLSAVVFPLNYQIMFLVAFLLSMIGIYSMIRLQVPDTPAVLPVRITAPRSLRSQLLTAQHALTDYPQFLKFTVNTLLHSAGMRAAAPLFIIYFVRELNADDAWLGVFGTLGSLTTIGGWAFWRWLMAKWGEPETLKRTVILLGVYPILVGLIGQLNLILLVAGLNGLLSPGMSLSHFNMQLNVTPESNRQEYTALFNTLSNIGAIVFPLLGVAAANIYGLSITLIGCGLVSIIGSLSFWLWPVRPVYEQPVEPIPGR